EVYLACSHATRSARRPPPAPPVSHWIVTRWGRSFRPTRRPRYFDPASAARSPKIALVCAGITIALPHGAKMMCRLIASRFVVAIALSTAAPLGCSGGRSSADSGSSGGTTGGAAAGGDAGSSAGGAGGDAGSSAGGAGGDAGSSAAGAGDDAGSSA